MPWKKFINYNKPYWLPNLFGFIGALFNGAMPPAFAFIFSSALYTFTTQGDALVNGGLLWGAMFVVLGVANFLSYYFNTGGFLIAGEYLTYDLRKKMYNSMIRQEVGFFDTHDIGDGSEKTVDQNSSNSTGTGTLTAKLETEAVLVQGINKNIGQIFQQIVTVIGGFLVAFLNSWKLTLILLITVPFLFLGSVFKLKASKFKNQENRIVIENSSKIAIEAIVSIKTIYALNLSDYFIQLYNNKLNEPLKRLERKTYLSSIGTGYSNSISYFVFILCFWVGSWFIQNGEMELNQMFMVLLAIAVKIMANKTINIWFNSISPF